MNLPLCGDAYAVLSVLMPIAASAPVAMAKFFPTDRHKMLEILATHRLMNSNVQNGGVEDSFGMTIIKQIFALFMGIHLLANAAIAQPVSQSREEIAHLLQYVEQSGCQFNRNGTWYQARDARLHLQKKYDYLDKRGLAPDAESFIERAASQSSVSGRAYEVRCADSKTMPSARWLTDELQRYRDEQKK